MPRTPRPTIEIESGSLVGVNKDSVAVFRGVPYAQAPVGDLRWRAPRPATGWIGTRDARKDGPVAVQRAAAYEEFIDAVIEGQGFGSVKASALKQVAKRAPRPKESEDCLYLTVRSPQPEPSAKLPVMVWIHGGDHQDGSNNDVFYASTALASQGVVEVSFNYRLGLMGYFAHPELTEESDDGVAGNYGTLDQIFALRWVRDNIAQFGGNPDNVTIFGESAGGESVIHMMTAPSAQGLFHRAVAQSPANSGQMVQLRQPFLDYDAAVDHSAKFADALGITGPDQLSRLRECDAAELYALVRAAPRLGDHYPVIDGKVLPESPFAAFVAGRQAKVPLIIGSNANEATVLYPLLKAPMVEYRFRPLPAAQPQPEMVAAFGPDMDRLATLYPGLDRRETSAEIDFMGDHMFGAPAYWYAKNHARAGQSAWLYQFTRTPPSDSATAGAFHAAELPFVHGTKNPVLPSGPGDAQLGEHIRQYWTQFATTGDPNQAGADPSSAPWPRFDTEAPQWLRLDHTISAEPVDRAEKFEILNARTGRLLADLGGATDQPAAGPAAERLAGDESEAKVTG